MFSDITCAWRAGHCCRIVPTGGGAAAADAPAQGDRAGDEARAPSASVLDELSHTLASARAAVSHFLDLMSLEARRAGLALMWMVALGFVAAVCLVAAWLGLMAALAMWAVSLGFPGVAAAIVLAVLNLLAGAVLIHRCIGMSRDLLFSATRRQVAGKSPPDAATP